MLADVSTDYYIRLEQGRERHPSERVLGALVRVLDLGPDAATHLYELAHPRPRPRETTAQMEQVSPDLLRLMRGWSSTPAFVCNRWMDVLAANTLATALFRELEHGDNLIRAVFLDPAARTFYRDWEKVARAKVAHLRSAAGADLDDPIWSSWSMSSPSKARSSAGCGRAMTSSARPTRPSVFTTTRSAI